jgi:hypothetical protein
MKTLINISNLKKVAVAICSTLVITSASAASIPEVTKKAEKKAVARLELIMNTTETALRFTAPSVDESDEVAGAVNFLDALAENTEESIRYESPEVVETAVEMESLENLALATEAGLRYKAPAADENLETVQTVDNESILANK